MTRRRKKTAEERTLPPLFGLSVGDVLRVAAAAGVDPRTVRAVVDGRGSAASRRVVVDALRDCKLASVAAAVEGARRAG